MQTVGGSVSTSTRARRALGAVAAQGRLSSLFGFLSRWVRTRWRAGAFAVELSSVTAAGGMFGLRGELQVGMLSDKALSVDGLQRERERER